MDDYGALRNRGHQARRSDVEGMAPSTRPIQTRRLPDIEGMAETFDAFRRHRGQGR